MQQGDKRRTKKLKARKPECWAAAKTRRESGSATDKTERILTNYVTKGLTSKVIAEDLNEQGR